MAYSHQLICLLVFATVLAADATGTRIIGGSDAESGEYPSVVSVQLYGSQLCAALVLSEHHALTSGRCIFGYDRPFPSALSVVVGTNDLGEFQGQRHTIKDYTLHPNFDFFDYTTPDIAVIEVQPAFVLSDLVQRVNLPSKDQETPAGSQGTIVGWGYKTAGGEMSQLLQEAVLDIVDTKVCQDAFINLGVMVGDEQICATTAEDSGACSGDSSAPLFVDGTLVGLATMVRDICTSTGYPGFFANVAAHVDWISRFTAL